jgi:hypothetical protein
MAFTFTPYSKEEAETVNKIIQLFKYHAAPQITTSWPGMFLFLLQRLMLILCLMEKEMRM